MKRASAAPDILAIVEAVRVKQSPEMKALFQHEGSEAVGNAPSEFGTIIKSEVERWKAVSRAAGIRAE